VAYFRLFFDVAIPNAWYLAEVKTDRGKEVLSSNFNQGQPFNNTINLHVVANVAGNPVDWRETAFGVPIASRAVSEAINRIAPESIQRIPVAVPPVESGFEIINILDTARCLDYERTMISRSTLTGHISSLARIRIVPEAAQGLHIFRLSEFVHAIIVSDLMKTSLECCNFTGLQFQPA
jgi:hypothetical protein